MYLRKILVRLLLTLYPAAWRKEYGEEVRSMLLAQPLTATVIVDVLLNAMRQNFRRPDPLRVAVLILVSWRTSWILWASISQLSPEIWPPFVQVDRSLFLLVALATGCWTTINEGEIGRGVFAGFWPALLAVNLAPLAAALLLFALAPHNTIPDWALTTADRFDNNPTAMRYDLAIFLTRPLASLCGALLGHLTGKRRASAPLNRA